MGVSPLERNDPTLRFRLDPGEPGLLRSAPASQSAIRVTAQELRNIGRLTRAAFREGRIPVFAGAVFERQIAGSVPAVVAGHTTVVSVADETPLALPPLDPNARMLADRFADRFAGEGAGEGAGEASPSGELTLPGEAGSGGERQPAGEAARGTPGAGEAPEEAPPVRDDAPEARVRALEGELRRLLAQRARGEGGEGPRTGSEGELRRVERGGERESSAGSLDRVIRDVEREIRRAELERLRERLPGAAARVAMLVGRASGRPTGGSPPGVEMDISA